ncbi:MAG: argininosuccinate lyase [Gammaproteobacteria bacterium]|nr:argininosuccinate lyase [Gammaproteobacteria bacterium]
MKLWGGRFGKPTDKIMEEFGASIHFDHILWREDILGSLAHVKALRHANVLSAEEALLLCDSLSRIEHKIKTENVNFTTQDEDIHMNIERQLSNDIGELAGKVHTGRSRNDQVALDMRLYMRKQILICIENSSALQQQLIHLAKQHMDIIFPGYTHLQRAQPIRLAHHWLAYAWMLDRDITRLKHNFSSTNILPLGAGAVAGTSFPTDQEFLARELKFDAIYLNSMDAVSDRDYLVEFLSSASLIMMHLSKLCEELIVWSSQEFSFIELDDAFCTGSSMMPQKKNPDAAELIRGKTGRVYGSLISMLTVLKGLPLAYNKDLQEDKEGVFDTVKTVNDCLIIMKGMMASLKINREHIDQSLQAGFLSATELANYLVKKGMPFRQAHERVGSLVKYCLQKEITFTELDLNIFKEFSVLFEEDIIPLLSAANVVELQTTLCGTAKASVMHQIATVEKHLEETHLWMSEKR